LDLAMDPDSEERYLAARVTVTKPDGAEEILSLPFEPEEAGTENAAEKAAGEAAAADEPPVAPKAEDRPSLMELIEQYGLNTVADASEGLFAAIRARIEASIAAAAETAEETETLEKVKTEREARNSAADGAGGEPADGADGGGEINAVTGKTARTLASYARAASLGSGSISRFSRHY
ncbi:MAG: hypothetical protein LIP28_11050, partial [Deltaproteobacteria bacterium]|nr:hypothetical protein [Deltaproteobacteria bacterium]